MLLALVKFALIVERFYWQVCFIVQHLVQHALLFDVTQD